VTEGGCLLIVVEGECVEGYLGRLRAGHVTEGGSLLIAVDGEGVVLTWDACGLVT
jgi:hypothetical protein